MGIFAYILYRNIRENTQNRIYEPLNVIFGANFIPYPKGLNTRDFLSQLWFVKILIPWTWGLWKGSKMVILGHFQLKLNIFAIMSP